MGLSSTREDHHHQSNQEEVQESMKTSSWCRRPNSTDISVFPQSDFFEICMTTFGKSADAPRRSERETRLGESKSADTEI